MHDRHLSPTARAHYSTLAASRDPTATRSRGLLPAWQTSVAQESSNAAGSSDLSIVDNADRTPINQPTPPPRVANPSTQLAPV